MTHTIDQIGYALVLLYAAAVAIDLVLQGFGGGGRLTISNRLVLAILLGFAAKVVILQPPMATVGLSLLIGLVALVVGFMLYRSIGLGGGIAKALAAALMFLGPTYLVGTLTWVAIILGSGLVAAIAIRIVRGDSRKA